jgi:hypothetical protein
MRTFAWILLPLSFAQLACAEESTSQPGSPPDAAGAATQPTPVGTYDGPALLKKLRADEVKPLVESIPGGQIDWTQGEVRAIGTGKLAGKQSRDFLMAQRAARILAIRNAVLMMSGIRAGPGGRFSVAEGQINVEAVVKDFKETSSDYDPKTETVTSTVAVPIYGVKGIVHLTGATVERPGKRLVWPAPRVEAPKCEMVVIDARGGAFQPCMFPQIVTEDGQTIFHAVDVRAERLAGRGMVVYASAEAKAALPDPAGVLTLKAKITGEKTSVSLVLEKESLERLTACPEARRTIVSGKVLILVAPPAPK